MIVSSWGMTALWCDMKRCAVHGHYEERLAQRVIRKLAKRYGWSRRKINGKMRDLCPSCSQKEDTRAEDISEWEHQVERGLKAGPHIDYV